MADLADSADLAFWFFILSRGSDICFNNSGISASFVQPVGKPNINPGLI
jgi:hypothetical protein